LIPQIWRTLFSQPGVVPPHSLPNDRYREGRSLGRQLLATRGLRFGRRSFVGKFDSHEPGDKFLDSIDVEVDGGALGTRFLHHAETVLGVPDELALREYLHKSLLKYEC
jgi:hypothetical protein